MPFIGKRTLPRYSSDGRFELGAVLCARDGLLWCRAQRSGDTTPSHLIVIPTVTEDDKTGRGFGTRVRAVWERHNTLRSNDVRLLAQPVEVLRQYPMCRALRDQLAGAGASVELRECPHAVFALPRGERLDRVLRRRSLCPLDALRAGIQVLALYASLNEQAELEALSAADFVATWADPEGGTGIDLTLFALPNPSDEVATSTTLPLALRRLLLLVSARWPLTMEKAFHTGPLMAPARARSRFSHLPRAIQDALFALACSPSSMWPELEELHGIWLRAAGIDLLPEHPAYDAHDVEAGHEDGSASPWSLSLPQKLESWTCEAPFARGARGEIYRARRVDGCEGLAKLNRYRHDSLREFREELAERRRELVHEAGVLREFAPRSAQLPRLLALEELEPESSWFSWFSGAFGPEPALIMERLVGVPLSSLPGRIVRRPLAVLWHMLEMARALQVFHRAGYLYQDLKTENLIFDPLSGRLSLVDVGSSCPLDPQGGLDATSPAFGAQTPGYSAPEFDADWRSVDTRFDIYSLGAVAYHLATGIDPERHALSHAGSYRPLPYAPLTRLPQVLRVIIQTCLSPARARYGDVEELIEAIHEAIHKLCSWESLVDRHEMPGDAAESWPHARLLRGEEQWLLSWNSPGGWQLSEVSTYSRSAAGPDWRWRPHVENVRVVSLPRSETARIAALRFEGSEEGSLATVHCYVPPLAQPCAQREQDALWGLECTRVDHDGIEVEVTRERSAPAEEAEELELRVFRDDGVCDVLPLYQGRSRGEHTRVFRATVVGLKPNQQLLLALCIVGEVGPGGVRNIRRVRTLPSPLNMRVLSGPGRVRFTVSHLPALLSSLDPYENEQRRELSADHVLYLDGGVHALRLVESYASGRHVRTTELHVDVADTDTEVVIEVLGDAFPYQLHAVCSPALPTCWKDDALYSFEFRNLERGPDADWEPLYPNAPRDADCVVTTEGEPLKPGLSYEVRATLCFPDGTRRASPPTTLRPAQRLAAPKLREELGAIFVEPPQVEAEEIEVEVFDPQRDRRESMRSSQWPLRLEVTPGELRVLRWRRSDLPVNCPFSDAAEARARKRPALPAHARASWSAGQTCVPVLRWHLDPEEDVQQEVRIVAEAPDGTRRLAASCTGASEVTDALWQGESHYVLYTVDRGLRSENMLRLDLPKRQSTDSDEAGRDEAPSQRLSLPVGRLHRLADGSAVVECLHPITSGILALVPEGESIRPLAESAKPAAAWWSAGFSELTPTTGYRTLLPIRNVAHDRRFELYWSAGSVSPAWQSVRLHDDAQATLPVALRVEDGVQVVAFKDAPSTVSGMLTLDALWLSGRRGIRRWDKVPLHQLPMALCSPPGASSTDRGSIYDDPPVYGSVSAPGVALLPDADSLLGAFATLQRRSEEDLLHLSLRVVLALIEAPVLRVGENKGAPRIEGLYDGRPFALQVVPRWSRRRLVRLTLRVATTSGVISRRFSCRRSAEPLWSWWFDALLHTLREQLVAPPVLGGAANVPRLADGRRQR